MKNKEFVMLNLFQHPLIFWDIGTLKRIQCDGSNL